MEQKQKYIELLQKILNADNSQKENISIFLSEFRNSGDMDKKLIILLSEISDQLEYSLWDENELIDKRLIDKTYIKELVQKCIEKLSNIE